MGIFAADDGTMLAYEESGAGAPLVCLPGGPMQASEYLDDIGGLGAHRRLVRLDLRGTGSSAVPADASSYRVDRQVDDVEALRRRLGLARLQLLGHSAGAALAVQYAAAHPDRIERLVLVCPSPRSVGLEIPDAARRLIAQLRRGEPWFPDAFAAFERIWAGTGTEAEWEAVAPFFWGRWDAASQAAQAAIEGQQNAAAAEVFYAAGGIDGPATRAALGRLAAPVLVVAGEYDLALPPASARELAALFPHGEVVVQPGAAHTPWIDDPALFVPVVARFLG